MTAMKTLDERVRERKDRYPVGFASRLDHILTRQRCEQAVVEEVLAENQKRMDDLEDQAAKGLIPR